MAAFDIVAGLDNATLNADIAEFYTAVHSDLLTGTVDVGVANIATIEFEVQAAPTADLTPSTLAREHFERSLAEPTGDLAVLESAPPAERPAIVEAAVGSTFELTAPRVQLTITYSSGATPTTIVAAITVAASVQTGTTAGQNYLTLDALSGVVSIPADPDLAALITNVAMPMLLTYLNANVLSFDIPTLSYGSVTISMPTPAVEDGYLLAFAALGTTQPDVPEPYDWPQGTVFIGTDAEVLVAAANTVLPIGPQTGFDWDIITGSVGATVGPAGAGAVTINDDGSLSVAVPCAAWANLTVHTPDGFPNFSFGPTASATLAATATPSVSAGELLITVDSIDQPSFDFDWGDIPSWVLWILEPLLDGLADALGGVLASVLNAAFQNMTIAVMSIPDFKLTLGGATYVLSIVQASTSAGSSAQGPLLLVSGALAFAPAVALGEGAAPPSAIELRVSRNGEEVVGDDYLAVTVGEVYEITAVIDGVPAVGCNWTVPLGSVVQDYEPTPDNAAPVPVGPEDLVSNPITLAFWQPGEYELVVTGYDEWGNYGVGQMQVTSSGPGATITGAIGFVRAGQGAAGAQWLQLADASSPLGPDQTGITLNGIVVEAPLAGQLAFIQLVTPSRYGVRDGQPVAFTLNGNTVLDAEDGQFVYQDTIGNIAQGGAEAITVTDNPAIYVTPDMNWTTMSVARGGPPEVFHTYLMYQPLGGIYVPLSMVTWYWQGLTVQNGGTWTPAQNVMQLLSSPQAPTGFPTWTQTMAAGDYAPGTD